MSVTTLAQCNVSHMFPPYERPQHSSHISNKLQCKCGTSSWHVQQSMRSLHLHPSICFCRCTCIRWCVASIKCCTLANTHTHLISHGLVQFLPVRFLNVLCGEKSRSACGRRCLFLPQKGSDGGDQTADRMDRWKTVSSGIESGTGTHSKNYNVKG